MLFFQTLLAQRSEPLGMEILTAAQSIFQVLIILLLYIFLKSDFLFLSS